MEKAKYGKMRQVNAVNGSQMVVKIGVVYYRRVKGDKGVNPNLLQANQTFYLLLPWNWNMTIFV